MNEWTDVRGKVITWTLQIYRSSQAKSFTVSDISLTTTSWIRSERHIEDFMTDFWFSIVHALLTRVDTWIGTPAAGQPLAVSRMWVVSGLVDMAAVTEGLTWGVELHTVKGSGAVVVCSSECCEQHAAQIIQTQALRINFLLKHIWKEDFVISTVKRLTD